MRGKLTSRERQVLSALIVIEVHARDVVNNMINEKVNNLNDFEWISQLRWAHRCDLTDTMLQESHDFLLY